MNLHISATLQSEAIVHDLYYCALEALLGELHPLREVEISFDIHTAK